MGYVERNLRQKETIVAKARVTWVALAPTIARTLAIILIGVIINSTVPNLIMSAEARAALDTSTDAYLSNPDFQLYQTVSKATKAVLAVCCLAGILTAIVPVLRLTSMILVVTDKKLIGKKGVFLVNSIDAYLEKIDNISINESLIGQIFHYATITVSTTNSTMEFQYISNAQKFKNTVMDCMDAYEDAKMRRQAAYFRGEEPDSPAQR